eukprot:CAMPEP_0181356494 /NCGR_PEP_ID=MMETSP1106-20121128/4453_1 /TAXON_ID=81844 /ORGANISM="Mantoniella antarctica, Strain SL-175" /LENGTH=170 /DNA_ID=CAMNT_0023469285 /DNA_START=113 /DNA_END=621 /DNA_ORIENTATION=-
MREAARMRSPQGEEEEGEGGIASDTVLCSYISAVGDGEGDALNKGGDLAVGLERVREALLGNGLQGGGGCCVICLENMSPHDSVWSCGGDDGDDEIEAATIDADVQSGCYYVMHLQCIQSWARQSLDVAGMAYAPALERGQFPGAAVAAQAAARWSCPSCRKERRRDQLP